MARTLVQPLMLTRLAALAAVFTIAHAKAAKPNFLILFGDDWGYGDIGANWAGSDDTWDKKFPGGLHVTPNIDKLAASGLRFTDFHVGASVCTPSRAALLTGRLGLRTGIVHNFGPASRGGLPVSEITLAAHLKRGGYHTAMIGKWHLGTTPGFSPTYHGFDEWFGLPYSDDMGCVDQVWPNLPVQAVCLKDGEPGVNRTSKEKWPLALYHSTAPNCSHQTSGSCNKDIIEMPADLATLAARYGAYGAGVIQRAAASKSNFLLYVAFAHMHVPQFCAAEHCGKTPASQGGHFADALGELDDTVGTILGALESSGLREDTLVLVTGDNGPWEVKCDLTGSKGPYLGTWQQQNGGGSSAKTTLWEAGHRTVGLASWPGTIKPAVSAALTSSLDYFPTLAALAGIPLPADRVFDGLDLSDLLLGKTQTAHTTLYHPNSGASGVNGWLDAVRFKNYKAIYQTGGAPGCSDHGKGAPTKGARAIHRLGGPSDPPLLFDLTNDPAEAHALDPKAHAAVLQQIDALRAKALASCNTTFHSIVDYSMCTPKDSCSPCCNKANVGCRCKD